MMQFLETLVLAAAIAGTLFLLWRPSWVFVLVISLWPMEQLLQAYVSGFRTHGTLFNYMIGGLAVVAVGSRVFRRDSVLLGYRNGVTVMVFIVYALWAAGLLWTPARQTALDSAKTAWNYQVLLLIFLPLLVLDIFEFRRMLTGVMVLGSVIAVLIIANPKSSYYSGRLYLDLGMVLGGSDKYGSPLALGELGGLVALVAALVRPPRTSQLFTLIRIAAFICGFGLAIGSGSRGQVLAAGICGIVFYPLARQLNNPRQFFVNVVGFGVLLIGIYFTFRMFVGQQNRERWDVFLMLRDTTARLDMAFNLFHWYLSSPAHWLLGLGTNAYAQIATDSRTAYVHNVIAEMLCEHGIVGLTLFVLIMILTFKYGKWLWMTFKRDPVMRATTATLLAICMYALLLALKQGSISYPAPFFWWLVMVKLARHEQRAMASEAALAPAEPETVEDHSNPDGDQLEDPEFALGY